VPCFHWERYGLPFRVRFPCHSHRPRFPFRARFPLPLACPQSLDRFTGADQDANLEGTLGDLSVSICALDLGSSHDTGDFMEVTVGHPDGPWQFIMHDVGGDLRVLASGKEVGFFPYTLSFSICSAGMIDSVLDRLTRTIEVLTTPAFVVSFASAASTA
jgi:hypothetical protein